ncbi:ABC-2 type transport system permease protein [Pedobacter sp. UYEF25]
MFAVFKREFFGFLNGMVAYMAIGIFLLVSGLLMWFFPDTSLLEYGYAELGGFFSLVPYLFMFLIPAITMRSFAEERREGTYELLVTKPITIWHIIWAKYLACFALIILALLPTLIYYYTLYQLGFPKGNIDTGEVIGSYLGLVLLGGCFTSVGIFASTLTKNQVVAFVICVALCAFSFLGFDLSSEFLSLQNFGNVIREFGINQHYQAVSRGVLDTRDLTYFLSFIAVFLAGSKLIMEGKG